MAVRDLSALLDTYSRGRVLKHGAGLSFWAAPTWASPPCSTLLAGYDRVIVTDIPGTTRDTVEETVRVGRHLLRLLDTAGIRETADQIEQMGVQRAEQAAAEADLAIFVCDGSVPLTEEDQRAMDAALECPLSLALLNKTDLGMAVQPSDLWFEYVIPVSAKTGDGVEMLEAALDMIFPEGEPCDGSILTNARQAGAVLRAVKSLESAELAMKRGQTPDAVLCDVEAAMEALARSQARTVRRTL